MFSRVRTQQMVRSTRVAEQPAAPSAMSAQVVDGSPVRSGRSRPRRVDSSAPEIRKLAASTANGAAAATANSTPPSGGPTRVVPAI
jgi:hypothetical protein